MTTEKAAPPLTPEQANDLKRRFRERVIQFAWPAKKEMVTVTMPANGPDQPEEEVVIEVRQPNMAQRTKILQAANMLSDDAQKRDLSMLMVRAAQECSFFPGTNVRAIDEVDIPRLMIGQIGWVDQLGKVATQLMNIDATVAAKKSETIPSSSSSA